ncbi:aldehyde dehydrogenase family protein [Streptomyces sp. NPDC005728]|uniref:aldehyde dehydrogenase family protein n=1 Tax=Streptomyces sp. NPDC005728 TaxID=3157054 RepID=UPI0033E49407
MLANELLIAGRWRRGRGAPIDTVDPATGRSLAVIHTASPEDVEEAAKGAFRAVRSPSWRGWHFREPARLLNRVTDLIERDAAYLAALHTSDTGSIRTESRALVRAAAKTFRHASAAAETTHSTLKPARWPYGMLGVREPIGVVGAITSWNSTLVSVARAIAPALAAGNAVLLKPHTWTPLIPFALARLVEQAGFPAGLLSVLPGRGYIVGDAIVRHPLVGKVAFTGSAGTAREIARAAADKLMPVDLELGGNSPTIVFEDADLEQALVGALSDIHSSSGQCRTADPRLFVARSRYEEFVGELVVRARSLRLGPGIAPGTQVAPLVHHRHRDTVAAYVDLARKDGARVLCGGTAPEGHQYREGAYYLPTVLEGLSHNSRVCREEILGPVLVALPFDDEDDLVIQAGDSVRGLDCRLWARDHARAWRVADRIEAGNVWINTRSQPGIPTLSGGTKAGGADGGDPDPEAIRAYQRRRSLCWAPGSAPLPRPVPGGASPRRDGAST